MKKFVPIDFLKSIEKIADVTQLAFNDFSIISRDTSVNFDKKLTLVKSLNETTILNLNESQKIILSKILRDILKEINSSFVGEQAYSDDIVQLLDLYKNQLSNIFIVYNDNENRVLMHYSPLTVYSRDWNNLTLQCRGVVIDLDNYNIVVHPYDKFFNYLEVNETLDENLPSLDYEVVVKLDGSEGILYPNKDGSIKIITKGSYDSEQGQYATRLLWLKYPEQANYIATRKLYNQYTFVFEILYHEDDLNRIVVKYKEPDLRLIGIRDLKTGKMLPYNEVIDLAFDLGLPSTQKENLTLKEILELRKDKENFEGWVVRYKNGLFMKIKCEKYLELHGFRFGTSLRAVFFLIQNESWDDFISNIPEDMRGVQESLHKRLTNFAIDYTKKILSLYYSIPKIQEQKEFASYVNNNIEKEYRGFIFTMRSKQKVDIFSLRWTMFRDLFNKYEQELETKNL